MLNLCVFTDFVLFGVVSARVLWRLVDFPDFELLFLFLETVRMLGPGMAFGQIRKEDRFYAPAKGRGRSCCQQWRVRCVAEGSTYVEKSRGLEKKEAECEAVKSCVGVEKCKPEVAALCNLERFMEAVTPSVPAYYLCKVRCSLVF